MILVGGLGTRLRPLTSTRPKPLLPVANVPLIARILRKLPPDVDHVILAVNYKLDQLSAHFAENDYGVEVTLVEEKDPLGTGGAIKNVEPFVDGNFYVLNGDILDSLDVRTLSAALRPGDAGAIALWQVADPTHYGIVARDADGVITRFVEKPESAEAAPSNLANAGTYCLTPAVFRYLEAGQVASVEREVFPAMIADGLRIRGVPFEGWWVDCGRPESYLKANALVLQHERRTTAIGPGVEDKGARIEDWAVVGEGASLGEGAVLSRSVVLPDAAVAANAVVRDSILGQGARVGEDAAVIESVLGDHAVAPKGVFLRKVRVEPETEAGEDG